MIELKNLSLYFYPGTKMILKDINWKIRKGDLWVLFGRNGSGKTKLLEIMAGYLSQSHGEVLRFGPAAEGQDLREVRKRIGIINTMLRNLFNTNEPVIDVVLSGLFATIGLYDEPEPRQRVRARELLHGIGMQDRERDRFGILSDGEKQKIILLRALINEPEMLIFDEPCMGLDISSREDLLSVMEKTAHERKLTVVYVTHHIEEIRPFLKKVFIIEQGESLYQGDIRGGLTGEMLSTVFKRPMRVEDINNRLYAIME